MFGLPSWAASKQGLPSPELKAGQSVEQSVEALSVKIGMVLLVLGGMHLFNLFVFSRMRRRKTNIHTQPPVGPDAFTAVKQEG